MPLCRNLKQIKAIILLWMLSHIRSPCTGFDAEYFNKDLEVNFLAYIYSFLMV